MSLRLPCETPLPEVVPQAEREGSAAVAKAVAAGDCVPLEAAVGLVRELSRERPGLARRSFAGSRGGRLLCLVLTKQMFV